METVWIPSKPITLSLCVSPVKLLGRLQDFAQANTILLLSQRQGANSFLKHTVVAEAPWIEMSLRG